MNRLSVAAAALFVLVLGPARACEVSQAWDLATDYDAAGRPTRRFVPPELYSGATWNGDRALVLRPIDVTRKPVIPSDHPPITFTGPMAFPGGGDAPVIKRARTSRREGEIVQYFAINDRSDGLGRLADYRSHTRDRQMAECFKFPVGLWEQGETRTCRESTIKIIEIDFTFMCVPHSLKFRWNDEGTYIYSPDRGMVAITH